MSARDVQQHTEHLKDEAERAKERVEQAAQAGTEAARGMVEQAREVIQEGAGRVATTLHDATEVVEAKGREMVHGVKDQIESRPMTSTLTALGIGFVLGWLLSSRRHG